MKIYSFTEEQSLKLQDVGLYLILVGKGIYIGKTSKSFKERFTCHWTDLNNSSHYNERCINSFKDLDRCLFIPIISINSKSEFNNDILITTLESFVISHFPIKDLLNMECKAPKENLIKLVEERYPEIFNETLKAISFVEEIIQSSSFSITKIRNTTSVSNYKVFCPRKKYDNDNEKLVNVIRKQMEKDPKLERKLKDKLTNLSNNRWKKDNFAN